jgi:hypothetical protein
MQIRIKGEDKEKDIIEYWLEQIGNNIFLKAKNINEELEENVIDINPNGTFVRCPSVSIKGIQTDKTRRIIEKE